MSEENLNVAEQEATETNTGVTEEQEIAPKTYTEEEHKQAIQDAVKQRADRFTNQKYGYEKTIEELRQENEKLKQPKEEEPSPEDISAYVDHRVKQGIEEYKQGLQANEKALKEYQAKQSAYQERAKAFIETHPDYVDVLNASTVELPPKVLQEIQDSDFAPQIAYEIAKNDSLAEKIAGMTDRQLDRWMAKQEVKYEMAPKETRVSNAPPPAEKQTGNTKTQEPVSTADWIKQRNEEMRNGRR